MDTLGTMVGFILGFVLGSKMGPLDMDEIQESWNDIRESEEAQQMIEGTTQIFMQYFRHIMGLVIGLVVPQK